MECTARVSGSPATQPNSVYPAMSVALTLTGLSGIPLVENGDDLATLLTEACDRANLSLEPGDVLVLAQKIVSKAEGRTVLLESIEPSERARDLAKKVSKDPRLVEVILQESRAVVRHKPGVLIVEDNRGLTLANAGIDHSNVHQRGTDTATEDGTDTILLLPVDPDLSAEQIRAQLLCRSGVDVGVVICDSLGRPWRVGTAGAAIGCAGVASVLDLKGQHDLFGEELRTTDVGHADQLAAAASIVMGQSHEAIPAVLVRGTRELVESHPHRPAKALLRATADDLFR